MTKCSYCPRMLDLDAPDTWQLVVGWCRRGSGASRRGGSDIAARQRREKFACDRCVRKLQRGINPRQEAMA